MLSETLSQYSALMVMEKEYGREKMQRFLKYELDAYLRGRGGELIEEMPLVLVEEQPYVHYRKGSLVMYALRDLIGEDKVNAALREQIGATAFQQPPYTTSRELYARFKKATPPQYQSALADLFERITIYENRATAVSWKKRSDGKYVIDMTVESKKLRDDGKGKESEVAVDDWIDVGVLAPAAKGAKQGKVLLLEKRRIQGSKTTLQLVVDEQPGKAGIDPLNKLIDRNPEDNLKEAVSG
jgi:ABC-2 type transport system permease protein